ncbi:MAG: dehydratase [Variovorax sp.]|nr:MAG: dehydratase [Variovorax sp.]
MLQVNAHSATIDEINIGDSVVLEKTISESDVYQFAGITGDFSPNHVNERYMKGSIYGTRIAQGALVVGFTSAAAAMFGIKFGIDGVAAGYDRIRFLGPVFFGDTIRIEYRITRIDRERQRTHAELVVTNQDGKQVLAGDHIIKFTPYTGERLGRDARGGA